MALALALAVLPHRAEARSIREIRQVEGVTEYALPNGFGLLLLPDASKPTTTVNLTYRAGSSQEDYGETGAAHLLEHLLFKASATVPDPKAELTKRGARWNGSTGVDRTNYFASFAADAETLDWTIRWLAESMTQAKLSKSDLDSEMSVVRNELERAENLPGPALGKRMVSVAYDWHGYGHHTLGARSDVEHISIERLRDFYSRYYRPDNAMLVVGGSFDAADVLAKVERAFGPIARPEPPLAPLHTVEPVQEGERSVTLRRQGGIPSVAVAYHVMSATSPAFAPMAVLEQLLALDNGPTGEALTRRGAGITQWAYAQGGRAPGYFMAGVALNDGADESTVAQAGLSLARTLESLQFTDALVEQARSLALKRYNDALRDPEALSLALSESIARGDWRLLFAMRDWIESVTPDEVRRTAARYFLPSNRTLGSYLPAREAPLRAPLPSPVEAATVLDGYRGRAVAPPTVDFDSTPANIQARTAFRRIDVGGQPGLRIAVLNRPTKGDRVAGTLRLHWGSAEAMKDRSVLASMVAPMLLRGTRNRSADDIAKALLALDARLTLVSNAATLTANFELPANRLPDFDSLLAELLREPAFADVPLAQLQKTMATLMEAGRTDPAAVANMALQRVFAAPATTGADLGAGRYPAGDPRAARTLDESIAQVRAVTAEQLREFWSRFAGAAHGELALVGPVPADAVATRWQQALGDWRAPERRQPWFFEWPADLQAAPVQPPLYLPEKPNAAYLARIPLVMDSDDPAYPALAVAVRMLGGARASALWKRVREDEGLSYGVEATLSVPSPSTLQPEGRAASITVTASFAPQNRARLQAVVRDELAKRTMSGFSTDDVVATRQAILKARANALVQPASLASVLATNMRNGYDMARYRRFDAVYEKVDADAANTALRKYLQLGRMVEINAGTFIPARE